MSSAFWRSVQEAALNVPCSTPMERSAWVCRNMAELALMVFVAGEDPIIVDDVVKMAGLEASPRRFAERLRDIRLMHGPVPYGYPACMDDPAPAWTLPDATLQDIVRFCSFAESLQILTADQALSDPNSFTSSLHSVGANAVRAREVWRPTYVGHPPKFIELPSLSPTLVWRTWMSLPGCSSLIVVLNERLSRSSMDVWWGIHNGTHLDHLSQFSGKSVAPIEFGSGLLAAEALAMTQEMLAGAEAAIAGDIGTQSEIRRGMVERLGRLPLPKLSNESAVYHEARKAHSPEFGHLPVLSCAYVIAPIQLLDARFNHPLISERARVALVERWEAAARQSKFVASLWEAT